VWTAWVNRDLESDAELVVALAEYDACGHLAHGGRPKNWDLLVALGSILERTDHRAAVLDMGSARYSRVLPSLYAYGYRRLVGIDLVPMELPYPTMVEYLTMDLTATTFADGSFDVITCLSVIEHGVSPDAFAREASRLLRQGGVVVLSTDFWCSPVDVAGKEAYGVPVHVLSPADIDVWIEAAARHGLTPVSPIELRCQDPVVRWSRVDLDFTFVNLVLVKGRRPAWALWRRGSYRRASGSRPTATSKT
ncbi:MAG: class I SAM-dependent methyltransferase, partial [Chloroflexi bacterium]|nr:class I SAM-dependent methyltransferase [Chloroflexota bacterium]